MRVRGGTWQRVDEGGDVLHAPRRGAGLEGGGGRCRGDGGLRRPSRAPRRATLAGLRGRRERRVVPLLFLLLVLLFLLLVLLFLLVS
jgi:hypothetical protein